LLVCNSPVFYLGVCINSEFIVVVSSPRASSDRDTPQCAGAKNDILPLNDIQPMLDAILDEEATVAKSPKKQRRNSVQQSQPTTSRQPLSPQKLNTLFKPHKGSGNNPNRAHRLSVSIWSIMLTITQLNNRDS